ncbi:hypothetical protein [Kamptonema formosum]|uniref:hypothetical protein n=1 Tax=Kamptonema formosum TaxID=331992 RepID=UPI00034C2EF4|nr:hypothetical protein [Oscillatoria sp. PCC 10802]
MVSTFEIQKDLQVALADRPIAVKAHLTKDELIIVINRSRGNPINYEDLLKIIENQLLEWQLDGIAKVKIFGRINDQSHPEWQKAFEMRGNRIQMKSERPAPHIQKNGRLILNIASTLTSKRVKVKASSRLMTVKLGLLGAASFTLIYGTSLVAKAETAGFIMFLSATVLATGLAVVEAIDILCEEIKRRD